MTPAPHDHVPPTVTVEWATSAAGSHYRNPAQPRRPRRVTRRWSRRGLASTASAGALGAVGGALTLAYGVEHGGAKLALVGASFAVIAGLLLDRVAPRLRNRTEVTLGDDALEVRHPPAGDGVTRVPYAELQGFEVEQVFDPVSARPAMLFQVNARLAGGRVEPVFPAVGEREEAEWLRRLLAEHARPA